MKQRTLYGFSLLEMLVALVLISAVGGALYSLLNNQFTQLRHFHELQQNLELRGQLLRWIKTIDPAAQPQGEINLGFRYQIRWHSTPITQRDNMTTAPEDGAVLSMESSAETQQDAAENTDNGTFQTNLYNVQAELLAAGQSVTKTQFIQVGTQPLSDGKPLIISEH